MEEYKAVEKLLNDNDILRLANSKLREQNERLIKRYRKELYLNYKLIKEKIEGLK